jgi:hypothetical protein
MPRLRRPGTIPQQLGRSPCERRQRLLQAQARTTTPLCSQFVGPT